MPSTEHHYKPLRQDIPQIRLLCLHPGKSLQYITATLIKHTLGTQRRFEALSYCWNQSIEDTPNFIKLNGSPFQVTTNFFDALWALRRKRKVRVIWIDAICVNQLDLEERSFQVQLMTKIYTEAIRTIAWVGTESEWSPRAIGFLRSMDIPWRYHSREDRMPDGERRAALKATISKSEYLRAIISLGVFQDLAQRPYWNRIWIVQEIALAKEVIVQSGLDMIHWSRFLDALFNLGHVLLGTALIHQNYMSSDGMRAIDFVDVLRDIIRQDNNLTLADLVLSLRFAEATDARDKVYALLGLLLHPPIEPDYSTQYTAEELYTSLVQSTVKEQWCLDIITMRAGIPQEKDLPLWAPDWSLFPNSRGKQARSLIIRHSDPNIFSQFALIGDNRKFVIEGDVIRFEEFTVGGGLSKSEVSFAKVSTATTMTTKGLFLGQIDRLGKAMTHPSNFQAKEDEFDDPFWESMISWEAILLECFGNCVRDDGNEKLTDVVDRWLELTTLHARNMNDELPGGNDALMSTRKQIKTSREAKYAANGHLKYHGDQCLVRAFVCTLFCKRFGLIQWISAEKYASFWNWDGDPESRRQAWGDDAYNMWWARKRRLVVLDNKYIGLVPADTKKEDSVAILYGCSVPVVLGERDGKLQLIGPAYIHGLMFGEALEDKSFEERTWTLF